MTTSNRGLQPGFEIPSVTKSVTLERMQIHSGPKKSIHTDAETAKKSGLPGPVMSGDQTYAYLSEMLRNFFGEGWFTGGKVATSFIGLVQPGDTLTTKGVVKEEVAEGSEARLVLDVWIENQNGEKVIVGTASGLVH